jgi:hypothetical protein
MVYQFTDFLLKIFFIRMNIDWNDKQTGQTEWERLEGMWLLIFCSGSAQSILRGSG